MKPFSGARYSKNAERCKSDETPCAVCGLPCKDNGNMFVHVIGGGSEFSNQLEVSEGDSGDMGLFPVGPECAKKLRKAGITIFDS